MTRISQSSDFRQKELAVGILTNKPTCLKKAWVNSVDADGLWKTKTGQTLICIKVMLYMNAILSDQLSKKKPFNVMTCAQAVAADTAGPGCAGWPSGFWVQGSEVGQ